MRPLFLLYALLALVVSVVNLSCQPNSSSSNTQDHLIPLNEQLHQLTSGHNAIVGISLLGPEPGDTLSINGDRRFPLQSVFKYHLAIPMLVQIDEGTYTLGHTVTLTQEDLNTALYSPMSKEHDVGDEISMETLLQYSIAQSDNVACDLLLLAIGGPQEVQRYFHSLGITDLAIVHNELDMQSQWKNMYDNWSTPKSASKALDFFLRNQDQRLSPESHAFLWETMKSTQTGANRLKGQLPTGTVVAHKTGTSGTNAEGLTPATNDIGVIYLPDGSYFILSVFVGESYEDAATNEQIIASIAKAVYDHFVKDAK